MLLSLAGCSQKQKEETAREEEQQQEIEEPVEDTKLYILLYSNADTQRIFLECVETGRQEEYEYNGGTYIHNRYGDSITIAQLQVGALIQISYTEEKMLTEVSESADTFLYDGITNFRVDSEKGILSVADSNYYYDEELKIFSDNGIISLNELSEIDTICIRGQGKEILTLVVTKGHGTIALKNTELFEGGMITIGNVAAREITQDMVIEVPEGTYTLSVANDGYGGSKEITVERFEEIDVDLDTLKGDGPGYCMMKINVTPSDAEVTINGGAVDCSGLLELKYGSYKLEAEAEGYTDFSGTLVVNSKEAAISIELDKESETETSEENTESSEEKTETTGENTESSEEKTETTGEKTDTTD